MKNIIDIRSPFEYQKEHVNGAISLSYDNLLFDPEKYLTKEEEYYLYCSSGKRSEKLSSYLNQLGYHVINLGSYSTIKKEL